MFPFFIITIINACLHKASFIFRTISSGYIVKSKVIASKPTYLLMTLFIINFQTASYRNYESTPHSHIDQHDGYRMIFNFINKIGGGVAFGNSPTRDIITVVLTCAIVCDPHKECNWITICVTYQTYSGRKAPTLTTVIDEYCWWFYILRLKEFCRDKLLALTYFILHFFFTSFVCLSANKSTFSCDEYGMVSDLLPASRSLAPHPQFQNLESLKLLLHLTQMWECLNWTEVGFLKVPVDLSIDIEVSL